MNKAFIDHIVIAAADLDQGAAYVAERLAVEPSGGGKHVTMGTHNRLLHLGGTVYLEVIAVDPDAPALGHARWFGLDEEDVQQRIARSPQVITWVAAVADIETAVKSCSYSPGVPVAMQRGDFNWQITIRDDGALLQGGLLPGLIQWPLGKHPTQNMLDSGCRLRALKLVTDNPAGIAAGLASVGADELVEIADLSAGAETSKQPAVEAIIETPAGVVTLA